MQTFSVNNLNELTSASRSGTLTVAGAATKPLANAAVNTTLAAVYADGSFAATGFTLANGNNTFTAMAQDASGNVAASTVTVNLPATPSYSYDLNGNLLSDGTRSFAYDDENQLTSVSVNHLYVTEAGFTYANRVYTWNATAGHYDGGVPYNYIATYLNGSSIYWGLWSDAFLYYVPGENVVSTWSVVTGIYAHPPAPTVRFGTNVANATVSAYYHADGNGNITALVDTNGAVVARYSYDPFGGMLTMSGPLAAANTQRFSSKEWCGNAGLYYYGYRSYDPNLQRWLNRDSIQEDGGINLYQFVANNPVNNTDLLGLDTCTCDRKIGGGPAKPRGLFWNTTPKYSHTFTFTTNPDGTIKHTYSWGNNANTHGWNLDQPEDITAAKEALKNGYNWNEGGKDLDPFVDQAFHELNKKENEHRNLGVARNCKTESEKLLDKARLDQKCSCFE